jgi:hypothetical protein
MQRLEGKPVRRRALAIAVVAWIALSGDPASASVIAVVPHYAPRVVLNMDPGDAAGLVGEQDVVFQCDPAWGPDECPIEGLDLRNVEPSVLLRLFPGLDDTARELLFGGPPVLQPPCIPGRVGSCQGGLYLPYPTNQFQSELAALSWNYMMLLIAYQTLGDPENPAPDEPDPNDPMSTQPGQCSFAQPQFCASVIDFLPEPGAALGSLTALLALAAMPRRGSR